MKSYLIFLFIILKYFNSSGQDIQFSNRTDSSEKSKEIISLSNLFFELVKNRDSARLNKIIHPDFLLTSSESNGEFLNKRKYVAGIMLPEILTVEYFRLHDFVIRFYGATAIVSCRIDWKSNYKGKPWSSDFLNTDIWVLESNNWMIVHRHSSYPVGELKRIMEERH